MSHSQQLPNSEASFPLIKSAQLSRNLLTRLLVGGTTVIVSLCAYFSYYMVRNAMLTNLKENAFLKVESGADEIDQWLAVRKAETEAIANSPITQTMNWSTIAPFFQAEYQRLQSFEPLLGIIDAQGKLYTLLKGATNINLSDRSHFLNGMSGRWSITDPILSRVNGKHIIVFAASIWSGPPEDKARKPIGVVNAPIGIDQVATIVQRLEYGKGSYAFALSSKGEAITHPNPDLMSTIEKPAPSLLQSNHPGLADIARQMVAQKQGIELKQIDQKSVYVAFLSLKETPWSVALVIPQENIESQLRLLDGIALAVLGLAGTLIAVLIYVQSAEQSRLKKSKAEAELLNQQLEERVSERTQALQIALEQLQHSQLQIVQSEKMSSLGQLVAGIAHEINNPVNFIHGNLHYVDEYAQDLLNFVQLYQQEYSNPTTAIKIKSEEIDLEFLQKDLPKMLSSMKVGTERIRQIVLSLRNFSRTDESDLKVVNLHEGIDSTLMILQHRLKETSTRPAIEVIKDYADLPLVECYAGQLNQVFMNILANAIDALEEANQQRNPQEIQDNPNQITIRTLAPNSHSVILQFQDNGTGIPEAVQSKIFQPFFTTKPVGKGTGMGMAISYQIITEQHQGKLECFSQVGTGTEFIIQLPIKQTKPSPEGTTATSQTAIA